MNILFVCKHNRFRSRVAEAYFNKVNKNKKMNAKACGLIQDYSPLDKTEVEVAKQFGINIKGKPMGISSRLLNWQDCIIVVANDIKSTILDENRRFGKKVIYWQIPDENNGNRKNIEKIIKQITTKINVFLGRKDE